MGGRHRIRFSAESDFNSTAVFITPMLDMAFQLLAFFVMTYHPSQLEVQFPVSLTASPGADPLKKPPPDQKPSPTDSTLPPPAITIIARAVDAKVKAFKGRLASLEIRVSGATEKLIAVSNGTEPEERYTEMLNSRMAELEEELKRIKKDRLPREDRLLLQGGYSLRWEESMRVFDSCRKSKDKFGRETELFPKIEMDTLPVKSTQ